MIKIIDNSYSFNGVKLIYGNLSLLRECTKIVFVYGHIHFVHRSLNLPQEKGKIIEKVIKLGGSHMSTPNKLQVSQHFHI